MYPLFLALLFFLGLSYLFYAGPKQRRIASQIEERIIGLSISLASPPPNSVSSRDVAIVGLRFDPGQQDASLARYRDAISKLLSAKAKTIYVNWQPLLHRHEEDYAQLLQLHFLAKRRGQAIYWVILPKLAKYLPATFREHAHILAADPCQWGLQITCVYNPRWNEWIIQHLGTRLAAPPLAELSKTAVISSNLPRALQAYLLFLAPASTLRSYSLEELGDRPSSLNASHYFVGPSDSVHLSEMSALKTLEGSQTPKQVFWARYAAMVMRGDWVRVVPSQLTNILVLLVTLATVFGLVYWGALSALGISVVLYLLTPLINAWSIRYLGWYLPVFNIMYAGVSTLLLATFAMLAIEAFRFWRLRLKERMEEEMVAVKGNFISLISHNLNTPVAKMQGMLVALEHFAVDAALKHDVNVSQLLLTKIQLAIRAVLVTTALEDGQINREAVTILSLLSDVEQSLKTPLKRLGCSFSVHALGHEDLDIPFRIDKRALVTAIFALIAVLCEESQAQKMQTTLSLAEDSSPSRLLVRIDTDQDIAKLGEALGQEIGPLLRRVSQSLLQALAGSYDGKLTVHERRLELVLHLQAER